MQRGSTRRWVWCCSKDEARLHSRNSRRNRSNGSGSGAPRWRYHALSQRPESDAALSELIEKYAATYPYEIASVLAFRGEADRAFLMLDRAARQRSIDLGAIPIYPAFKNLHDDPRWLPFLRKLGMAPEQLAAIKFDVKVPN